MTSPHMTPDQFRSVGHELIEWVASYMERVEELPVVPAVQPGDVRAMLPAAAPEQGEGWDAIVADLDRIVVPATTHWQHPGWYAYFPANGSGPSILGELVAAGLGMQGMLWSTGPVCTELETHVMDWLVELLGLPAHFSRTPRAAASSSTPRRMPCCARSWRRASRPAARAASWSPTARRRPTRRCEKDLRVAGIPHLRTIEVDDAYAMRPDELARQIAADRAAGLRPFFCCASLGTTVVAGVRPGARRSARSAATPGSGSTSTPRWPAWPRSAPSYRWLNDGVELASS